MLTLWQARDVAQSYYGYSAGGSIPHSAKTFAKQTFMQEMSHRWKCEYAMRTLASPHIKSYCCWNPKTKLLRWFLLTSANFSKAAWGTEEKDSSQFRIRSYEAGVLIIADGDDAATHGGGGGSGGGGAAAGFDGGSDGAGRLVSAQHPLLARAGKDRIVPLPYDLPLTKYEYTTTAAMRVVRCPARPTHRQERVHPSEMNPSLPWDALHSNSVHEHLFFDPAFNSGASVLHLC